jgi:hypothetical protein
MKYKFSKALNIDYSALKNFISENEELTKDELLEKCAGAIDYDLLQYVKELDFDKIGKDRKGDLYLM